MVARSIGLTGLALAWSGCLGDETNNNWLAPPLPEVTILKWYGGREAAISLTYDAPWRGAGCRASIGVQAAHDRGLAIDLEMVTAQFEDAEGQEIVAGIPEELFAQGSRIFGHGHTHINHDSLSLEQAFEAFSTCYRLMDEWGLVPRAYAYPQSAGRLATTQIANELAGFICARGWVGTPSEEALICPDQEIEPELWHYLPSIAMSRDSGPSYVSNHEQLEPYMQQALDREAWLILMYHSIGLEGSWGYYELAEFEKDVDFVVENDFWCGNMDMVAL